MRIPLSVFVCLLALPAAVRADEQSGEQIYKKQCNRCHSANGEGSKKAQPLVGEKSIPQLANVIQRTMPEDNPGTLDAAESKRVAEYIFNKFYSPAAQAKIKPPRVDLTHLTVRQYRNSIADIIGSFRGPAQFDNKQGLHGEYYNSRGFQGNKKLIDRTDSEVKFDFKTAGPESEKELKEKFDPHQFSIRWEGSVLAPETGLYEFVVRTDHALRLWVNDPKKPVIDGWVKSGSDTEFRTGVFLLAGRAYPVKLEFSKAKQGVDDSKKNPNPPAKPAFISLLWKRPKGTLEVIPARNLSPARTPEVAVIEAPFPPDDRSLGWERGTGISKEWDTATTDGAIETASYILAHLPELAGVSEGAKEREPKLRAFANTFAERAFRHPLSPEEKKLFVDRQFDESAGDPDAALKRVILLVLKSPRFLYPEAGNLPEQYAVASRLALTLWDSLPDKELLQAAAQGKLGTVAEVKQQAERMLADPRAKAKIHEFLLTWLRVDQAPELAKDAKRFPGFDAALAADLRTSLELFLDDVVWSEDSDLRKLFLGDELYLNGRLAKFYGVDMPADEPFKKVQFDSEHRTGILTHPYMLSVLAYTGESSPIHRGVFVARGVLGVTIRPPQDAFTPLAADLHPKLTTRERVSLQTKPMNCAACHGLMNPLGFALENFDAVGRFRAEEKDKPVDASGFYETRAGTVAKFTGAKELAKFLAESPEVPAAFVDRLFHHLVKQPVRAYGANCPEELQKFFAENKFNIRKLVVEISVSSAMAKRELKPPK
jgi:mono/diheme cytochrome c family protein